MELANIEKLIKKYENAETSLQEETILRDYFAKKTVASHLQEYQYVFNYYKVSKNKTYTKKITLSSKKSNNRNLKWFYIAASIVLLLSVFIGKQEYDTYQLNKKYAHVKNALELLSSNLKKGEQAVATLYTYENTVNKILK